VQQLVVKHAQFIVIAIVCRPGCVDSILLQKGIGIGGAALAALFVTCVFPAAATAWPFERHGKGRWFVVLPFKLRFGEYIHLRVVETQHGPRGVAHGGRPAA